MSNNGEYSLGELGDAFDRIDQISEGIIKKKKKKNKICKSYKYQKSMLYAIQAITKEPTHEIIAKLVEEADAHIAASDIDLSRSPKDNARFDNRWTYGRKLKKYMFYPETKLYLGLYVSYEEPDWENRGKYNSELKYNFKLPTSSLELNQKEFDEYIADGILCDVSKDVERPQMNSTLTKEEKEIKAKLANEKAKRKAKAKRRKKLTR